jgi:hypothetical protein
VIDLALAIPPELVDAVAERVIELLAERQELDGGDRWLRGAKQIADYIAAPVSRVNALSSAKRIPVHHDGAALVAHTAELDEWIRDGGGIRP